MKDFITKYTASATNDNLPVYGRLIVRCVAGEGKESRRLFLRFNKPVTIKKLSGASLTYNGYYDHSDKSDRLMDTIELKANKEYLIFFADSDVDSILAIDGKYDVEVLSSSYDWTSRFIRFNLDDLKYCGSLKQISFPCVSIPYEGSLANVSETLTSLAMIYDKDLNDISHLTNLKSIDLRYSNTSAGDISALSPLVNLTSLDVGLSNVSGDISALSPLVNLTSLSVFQSNVSGDISALSSLVNLTSLNVGQSNVSGDITDYPSLSNLAFLCVSPHTTGDIKTIIDKCSKLKELEISKTGIGSLTYTDEQIAELQGKGVTVNIKNN